MAVTLEAASQDNLVAREPVNLIASQDDRMIFQLREQHDIIKECMGELVIAPINFQKGGLRILDSGTADGFWLHDLANDVQSEASNILIGTDITSTRFPASSGDVTLRVQSICEPWPEEWKSSFDLVHQRFVLGGAHGFPLRDAVSNLCGLVKPGGWIQLVEPEQTRVPEDGPVMNNFVDLICNAFKLTGVTLPYAPLIKGFMLEAGFEDVREEHFNLPLGAAHASPEMGAKGIRSTEIVTGFFLDFVRRLDYSQLGVTAEQLDNLIPEVSRELSTRGGHYPFRVVWGRRPIS